jgi:hypothetical protein
MNVTIFFEALRREQSLPNPVAWKIAGIVAMIVVGLVNTVYPVPVTMDQIVTLIGVAFSVYTQIATSRKVGIPAKENRGRTL